MEFQGGSGDGYYGAGGGGNGGGGRRRSRCQYYRQECRRRYFLLIKLAVQLASANTDIDLPLLRHEINRMLKKDSEMEKILRRMSGQDYAGTTEDKFFQCIFKDINQFARISGSMKPQQPSPSPIRRGNEERIIKRMIREMKDVTLALQQAYRLRRRLLQRLW